MNIVRRLVALCTVVVATALMTACVATVAAPTDHHSRTAGSASSAPVAQSLTAGSLAPGERLLGQLNNSVGTAQLGPFTRSSDRVAVYVECVGSAPLQIQIDGVGSFPVDCSQSGPGDGIRNTFDVRFVDTLTVTGQADNTDTWAMSLTALDS